MSNPATPNSHKASTPNSPPAKGEYPEGGRGFAPKLRFPEFRDAPEWGSQRGDTLFDLVNNRSAPPGLPVLAITQEHGAIPRDQIDYHVSATAKSIASYKEVCEGDFIISLRSFQGGIEYSLYHGICSPAYVILRGKLGGGSSHFFRHLFKSQRFIQQLTRNIEGIRDGKMISYAQFSEQLLPTPEPSEQQKIADCLNSLDDLIAAEDRKLEALRQHKQGLIQQLFPQPGETVPRLRFPEFRDSPGWKKGKCLDIADVLPGFGFPDRFQGNSHGQYPFYKVSDISQAVEGGNKYIREANNYIETDVLRKIRAKLVPAGTIIFAKIGEAIRSNRRAITMIPAVIDNNTAGLKSKSMQCSDEFLFYLWSKVALSDHAGGVVPAVSKSALENIPLYYPINLAEQLCIANCLSTLDSQIGAQLTKLDALREHKQGLMQQIFPSLEAHLK